MDRRGLLLRLLELLFLLLLLLLLGQDDDARANVLGSIFFGASSTSPLMTSTTATASTSTEEPTPESSVFSAASSNSCSSPSNYPEELSAEDLKQMTEHFQTKVKSKKALSKHMEKFWSIPPKRVLAMLASSKDKGLTSAEAKRRQKVFGANLIKRNEKLKLLWIFVRQFLTGPIILLIIAAILSAIFADYTDGLSPSIHPSSHSSVP